MKIKRRDIVFFTLSLFFLVLSIVALYKRYSGGVLIYKQGEYIKSDSRFIIPHGSSGNENDIGKTIDIESLFKNSDKNPEQTEEQAEENINDDQENQDQTPEDSQESN